MRADIYFSNSLERKSFFLENFLKVGWRPDVDSVYSQFCGCFDIFFSIVDKNFVLQAADLQTDINLFSLFIPSMGYGDAIKIRYGAYQNRRVDKDQPQKSLNLFKADVQCFDLVR